MKDIKLFISHSSVDKKYGQALVNLFRCLGINRNQIIFTSTSGYGIPDGDNIFEYLKRQIESNVYILLLLSNNYYESVACLNEMGATWVLNNDYDILFIPNYNCNNKKYFESAIDNRKSAFGFDRESIIGLKNKIIKIFQLYPDEFDWNDGLVKFLEEIETINSKNVNDKDSITINDIDKEKLKKDCIDSMTISETAISSLNEIRCGLDGYYSAIIKEIRPVPKGYTTYKLNGLISEYNGNKIAPVDGESHWLLYKNGRFDRLCKNDRVRFKIHSIKGIESYREGEKSRNILVVDIIRNA